MLCIIVLLIAAIKLCARADEPRKVNFSDYPIIAMEQYIPNPDDVTMLAKLIYGEARGIESQTEQAAVVWTVLNRVDSTGYGMGKSIEYAVTFRGQLCGYSPYHPVYDDYGTRPADSGGRCACQVANGKGWLRRYAGAA